MSLPLQRRSDLSLESSWVCLKVGMLNGILHYFHCSDSLADTQHQKLQFF